MKTKKVRYWIQMTSFTNTVTHQWLQPDTVYQLGRDRRTSHRSHFIRVNEVYISKEHLQIHIGKVNAAELENPNAKTPLRFVIQSKAYTKINGEKAKLSAGQEPFLVEIDYDKDVTVEFREDKIRLKIFWKPLVLHFPHRVQIGDTIQQNPVIDQLHDMAKKGIDLRTTDDPELATHYIASNDSHTYGLRIALLRANAVVSEKWIDFVLQHKEDYQKWFDVDTTDLLPTSQSKQYYLFPNTSRQKLLENCIVWTLEPPTSKLHSIIGSLSGELQQVQISTTGSIISTLESHLLEFPDKKGQYLLTPKFSKSEAPDKETQKIILQLQSSMITLDDLFKSVIDCSTLNLNAFSLTNELKRNPEPMESQKKRRRIKKVSKTEFFNFGSVPSISDSPAIKAEQLTQPSFSSTELAKPGHNSQVEASDPQNDVQMEPQKATREEDSSTTAEITKNDQSDTESSKKRRVSVDSNSQNEEVNPAPQVTFYEAVKRTKKTAEDSLRKDLGLDDKIEDDISGRLINLAVVEYVSLQRPKTVKNQRETNNYDSRKNFKNFRKGSVTVNMKRKVELVAETTNNYSSTNKKSVAMITDFASEMPSVIGVEPRDLLDQKDDDDTPPFSFRKGKAEEPANSLFVDEDDSQSAASKATTKSHKLTEPQGKFQNNLDADEEDDDDDDDDDDDENQPRFSFRRN